MSDGSRTSRKSNSPQKPVFNSDIRVGETISRKETTIKVGELKLSTHPGSRGRLPPTPGRSPLSTPSRRPRNSPLGMRRRSPSPFHSSDFSARSGPRQTGTAPPMLVPGSSTVRTSTPYTDNTVAFFPCPFFFLLACKCSDFLRQAVHKAEGCNL
jgi:hypothetical protein